MVAAGVHKNDLARSLVSTSGRRLILFAGEHTHATQSSTIHGAYNSGKREALKLSRTYT
jgi:monoamine oxidase